MRTHTNGFKTNVKEMGRELKGIITFNDTTLEDELFSITPHFEANILKSVMKQLDIETSVDIPLETVLNCQIGIKVNDNYEMLDFGNYVVYSSEKKEDTNTYNIVCYDKMLYTMRQNEDLNITYPITIKNYLTAVANKIGLTVSDSNFYNQDLQIVDEKYLGSEYTYRDILDEIAQATGSIICINTNDELEVKYPINTNDTINEEYLKSVNVNFGKKYGPVNSIVLSRSEDSDNVYIKDEESIEENGLCEIKISDNQIMNDNNRSDFLQGILNALGGFYYYVNNFSSTGILYYEIGDIYNISIDDNNYQCCMLNDEIDLTTGMEEIIYTDMPEESETDYEKADKTDRKINQTYLLVDKQNQTIDAVVSQVSDQEEQIASIRLQYNELLSRISDIADITTSGESSYASVNLVDVNTSQPIDIKIHPITENISYLYPWAGLFPSSTLYPKSRKLRFTNTTTNEIFDWVLPTDLWYYNSSIYDELELSYGDGTNSSVIVTRKCQINSDATISALTTPTTETYSYPTDLVLTDGDYTIQLVDNTTGYLYVQLMAKNIYTTQFYTKAETNSVINQKADEITLGVNQTLSNYSTTNEMNSAILLKANEITSTVSNNYETKTNAQNNYTQLQQTDQEISSTVATKVGEDEIISKINQTPESITINAGKINLSGYLTISNASNTYASKTSLASGTTTINGGCLTTGTINANNVAITNINASNITSGTISASKISGGSLNLTGTNTTITSTNFSVDKTGKVVASSGTMGGWTLSSGGLVDSSGNIYIRSNGFSSIYTFADMAIIRNYLLGNIDLTAQDISDHFDVTGDGQVTSGDILLLRNKILGLE